MTRTPLFTFKHYASVIRVLRATRPRSNYRAYAILLESWKESVNAFASMFASDNPRFKRDLFVAECNRE